MSDGTTSTLRQARERHSKRRLRRGMVTRTDRPFAAFAKSRLSCNICVANTSKHRDGRDRHRHAARGSTQHARHLRQCRRRTLSRDLDQQRRPSAASALAAQQRCNRSAVRCRKPTMRTGSTPFISLASARPISTAPLPALLDTAVCRSSQSHCAPIWPRRAVHPARRPRCREAPCPRPRHVSHHRDITGQSSGLARAARRA